MKTNEIQIKKILGDEKNKINTVGKYKFLKKKFMMKRLNLLSYYLI